MSNDFSDALNKAADRAVATAAPQPTAPSDADEFIVALALQWGEDPEKILKEFHGNSALAKLCRKIMGVNMREPFSSDERTYLICLKLQADGLKGRKLHEEAARCINEEQNAAGRRVRTVDAASIKAIAGRGKRSLQERMTPLAQLFL